MKPERGAAGLLVLIEGIVLAAVIALGIVKGIRTPETEAFTVSDEVVNTIEESTQETEAAGDANAVPEPQPEESFSAEVQEKLSAMTIQEKAAQMFLTTPESLTQSEQVNIAGAGTRNAINEYPVGGLIYSGINFQGREQAGNLMFNAGGISSERIGLYLFLAVNTASDGETPVIGIADSYEPDVLVEALARDELPEDGAGICIPAAYPDGQDGITAETDWVMLEGTPDAALTGDENLPCMFSEVCVNTLRQTVGYRGLVLTESLSSENIADSYSVGEAAVLAIQAGADMVYCPNDFPIAYRAVLDALEAGEITEGQLDRAVGHILTRKYRIPVPVSAEADANDDNAMDENMPEVNNPEENPQDEGTPDENNTDENHAE